MLLGCLMVLHLVLVMHVGLLVETTRMVAVMGLPAKTMEMDTSRACQAQVLQPHQGPLTLLNQIQPTLLNPTQPTLPCRLLLLLRMEMDAAPSITRIASIGAVRLMTLA